MKLRMVTLFKITFPHSLVFTLCHKFLSTKNLLADQMVRFWDEKLISRFNEKTCRWKFEKDSQWCWYPDRCRRWIINLVNLVLSNQLLKCVNTPFLYHRNLSLVAFNEIHFLFLHTLQKHHSWVIFSKRHSRASQFKR